MVSFKKNHQFYSTSLVTYGARLCLGPFGLWWQNPTDWEAYTQRKYISYSSKGWEVRDPGASRVTCLFTVSSCGRRDEDIPGFSFIRALLSWPDQFPKASPPNITLEGLNFKTQIWRREGTNIQSVASRNYSHRVQEEAWASSACSGLMKLFNNWKC